jgi:hypothetical protein
MAAAYPNSLLNWTARVNSQTVQAADPNTLAAEIDAIESAIGTNPQNEPSPLTNSVVSYANLSQRVSAAYLQSGHPYIGISGSFNVSHSASLVFNPGTPTRPTGPPGTVYPAYVGVSGNITIQDSGLWLINANQSWDYAQSGWVQHVLYVAGAQVRRSVFSYDQFPSGGSNSFGERFINQYGMTETTYLGRINAGSVVRVASGNYTNRSPILVESATLTAYYLRS